MPEISYRSPEGTVTSAPPLDMLLKLISDAPVSYWEAGSGEASLEYKDGSCISVLMLFYSKPHGFFIEYRPNVLKHNRYFSIGSGVMDEVVTLYVSGEPHKLPVGVFVSTEAAQATVEEFFRSGQRTDKLVWRNRRDLSWDDDSEES